MRVNFASCNFSIFCAPQYPIPARNSLRQAIEQVNLTRNSLDKACENETMALERYGEGKSSVIEVIDAQTYRQLAQMNYVHAKVSAQNYYSELLKALNKY